MVSKNEENQENSVEIIRITKESGIPLIGFIAFGVLDRGTNLLQVRCTSICNMKCTFCSTSANNFNMHPINYIVDIDYLLEEVEKVVEFKGENVHIFLDSVGDPMSHPNFIELVEKLKKIKNITKVDLITNGSFLNKEKILLLEKAGLNRLNISVHSLNELKSKLLFGNSNYNIEKIKENLKFIKETKIELWITPVWIPKINDEDIIEIIKFCKENNFNIGLQKYETYKHSRKVKKARNLTYWKFYKQLENWEKEFGINLKIKNDPTITRRKSLPLVFDVNEKIQVIVVAKGWFKDQVIAKAKDRCVTVLDCNADIGNKINVKIIENKNNIYIATMKNSKSFKRDNSY